MSTTKAKCDHEYEHDVLHIHPNKCKPCKFFSRCKYVMQVKEKNGLKGWNEDAEKVTEADKEVGE